MKRAILAAVLALAAAPVAAQDFRPVAAENLMVIDTTKGRVIVELRPDIAPNHVARVRTLIRKGFYNDNAFYRVDPGSLVETGQKAAGGSFESGLGTLKAEFSFKPAASITQVIPGAGFSGSMAAMIDADGTAWPKYCPGTAAMAHYDDPNSGDAQFFLMIAPAPSLERLYTAWGRIVSGQAVLNAFAPGRPAAKPDLMVKVRLASDMPEAERPKVSEAVPGSAPFNAAIAKARKARGSIFDLCDVETPVQVN